MNLTLAMSSAPTWSFELDWLPFFAGGAVVLVISVAILTPIVNRSLGYSGRKAIARLIAILTLFAAMVISLCLTCTLTVTAAVRGDASLASWAEQHFGATISSSQAGGLWDGRTIRVKIGHETRSVQLIETEPGSGKYSLYESTGLKPLTERTGR